MTLLDLLLSIGLGKLDAQRIARRLQSGLIVDPTMARSILETMTPDQMIQDARFGWYTHHGHNNEITRLLDPEAVGDPSVPDHGAMLDRLPKGKAWPTWLLPSIWEGLKDHWEGLSQRSLPDLPSVGDPAYDEKLLHLLGRIDNPYPGHPAQAIKAYFQAKESHEQNDLS